MRRTFVVRTMWWSNDVDDAVEIAHVCSDSCAKAIRGSWVCTMNGTVLGPALLENIKIPKPQTPIKNRADCNPAARGRFVTSVQALLTKLVKVHPSHRYNTHRLPNRHKDAMQGDKRTKVEGARAGKGRVHALRNATRSVQSDIEKGKLPNVGIALCVAWTSYEKSTNALDVLAELDQVSLFRASGGGVFLLRRRCIQDTETHLLQECGDFFCKYLAKEPGTQTLFIRNSSSLDADAHATQARGFRSADQSWTLLRSPYFSS